jgi:hypothetical protein
MSTPNLIEISLCVRKIQVFGLYRLDKTYFFHLDFINVTFSFLQGKNIIQLMTYDEVNTRIDQPMEHDIHRGTEVSEVNIMFHGLINPCIHRN